MSLDNPRPAKKLKLSAFEESSSDSDLDQFLDAIDPDYNSDQNDNIINNSTNTISPTMFILESIKPCIPLVDKYLVQIKANEYHELHLNYDNSDTLSLKSQNIQSVFENAIKTRKGIIINKALESSIVKHGRPKQRRTLIVRISSSTDITLTIIEETLPTPICPFSLFSINYTSNIHLQNQYLNIIGYLVRWENRYNYQIAVAHILNKEYAIEQSAFFSVVKNSKQEHLITPGTIFCALNVKCVKVDSNYRLYLTYSKIIELKSEAFIQTNIITNALHAIKFNAMKNPINNSDRPEWISPIQLDTNFRFTPEALKKLQIGIPYRFPNAIIVDCSKSDIRVNCCIHRTPTTRDCVVGHHEVTNEQKEYNFSYKANLTVMDVDQNKRTMKPNWKFMQEATGYSIHKLAKKWKK
eukprot:413104_1